MGRGRHVPDYGVQVVPARLRKRVIGDFLIAASIFGLVVLVGIVAFRPLSPPAPPAAAIPAPAAAPATATSAR